MKKIIKNESNLFDFQYDFSASNLNENYTFLLTDNMRRLKIFATFLILSIGLIGHALTISVFGQRKFRKNISHIVSLCLAINDSLYLIVICFEDITIDLKELYLNDLNNEIINKFLNLINENLFTCCFIHYLKCVLRFLSAVTITELTIQRFIAVYFPIWLKFKNKKFAWKSVLVTLITALIANIRVLFTYEIIQDEDTKLCQVRQNMKSNYYKFNVINVFLIVAVPILIIFICNSLIILKLFKRKSEQLFFVISKKIKTSSTDQLVHHKVNVLINGVDKSKILTKRLILTSFTYVLFSFPYMVTWISFVATCNREINEPCLDYINWYIWFQLTEFIYNINFCLHFFIYCISGTLFRSQLKSRFI